MFGRGCHIGQARAMRRSRTAGGSHPYRLKATEEYCKRRYNLRHKVSKGHYVVAVCFVKPEGCDVRCGVCRIPSFTDGIVWYSSSIDFGVLFSIQGSFLMEIKWMSERMRRLSSNNKLDWCTCI